MNKFMYIIYLVLLISTSVLLNTLMVGPMYGVYFVRTSFIFVLLTVLIPTIWPFGIKRTISCFREVFSDSESVSGSEAISYFKNINIFILTASVFAFFLCSTATLSLIRDPEVYGPNLATTLTIPLYSVFLSVAVFLPFRFILERKYQR